MHATRDRIDEVLAESTENCLECGAATALRNEPGATVGGLVHPCGRWCEACQILWLPTKKDLVVAAADLLPPSPWAIASSGVSVSAGPIRIRLDGGSKGERETLARAIARLPELLAAAAKEGA